MSYTDYQFTTQVSRNDSFHLQHSHTYKKKTNETPLNNRFHNVYISKSTFSSHMAKSVINKISQWLTRQIHHHDWTLLQWHTCHDIHDTSQLRSTFCSAVQVLTWTFLPPARCIRAPSTESLHTLARLASRVQCWQHNDSLGQPEAKSYKSLMRIWRWKTCN